MLIFSAQYLVFVKMLILGAQFVHFQKNAQFYCSIFDILKMLILSAQKLIFVKMLNLDNLEQFFIWNPHQITCLYQGTCSADLSCEWEKLIMALTYAGVLV